MRLGLDAVISAAFAVRGVMFVEMAPVLDPATAAPTYGGRVEGAIPGRVDLDQNRGVHGSFRQIEGEPGCPCGHGSSDTAGPPTRRTHYHAEVWAAAPVQRGNR